MTEIYVIDDQDPEDNAMMQALYSRSPKSVMEHMKKVREVGSGKFMDQYYVGYSHKSIGDCGSTTVYIENVSMLAAKAIQDTPLYNGQEASTRYLDMVGRPVVGMVGGDADVILWRWLKLYEELKPLVLEDQRAKYPRQEGEKESQYEKALKAKTFDIVRGFLPAGCTTYVSWHVNLRQAADHLDELRHYPLLEVRALAHDILGVLKARYPNSFGHKQYDETEEYLKLCGSQHLMSDLPLLAELITEVTMDARLPIGDWWNDPIIRNRPAKCRLPHRYDALGQISYRFPLDFGSFRDLQRHRNGVCRMPLLGTDLGFNQWYLDQLPESVLQKTQDTIGELVDEIHRLDTSPQEKQHYVAMGFNVPCHTVRGLPGTLYLIELRTTPAVHPTMRAVAQEQARLLRDAYPRLTMHDDQSPDAWTLRRGAQDIVEKV